MSEVSYVHHPANPLSQTIEWLVSEDDHIVIVKGPISNRPFLKVILPKETHYLKAEESTYEDFVFEYEVLDVIKSNSFKAGDHLRVWQEPNYSLEDIRIYHETGLLKSPVIFVRDPNYPLKEDCRIVFARKMDSRSTQDFSVVYSVWTEEGIGAEQEIRKLIKALERK